MRVRFFKLQMNVGLHLGFSNVSEFSTFEIRVLKFVYYRCAAHLFNASCNFHVTVTSFSVFYFYYYC